MSLRIASWCWHTPYLYNLAHALPDIEFDVYTTPYNPTGWNVSQRPKPENVHTPPRAGATKPDAVLAQSVDDLLMLTVGSFSLELGHIPVIYLAHNHAGLDWPNGLWKEKGPGRIRLICISERKMQSYRVVGYHAPIRVIPPGIDVTDFLSPWQGTGGYALTVCNDIKRKLFDAPGWMRATAGLPVKLVGEGNESLAGVTNVVGPATSWEELKALYQYASVYLNPTTPPYEDAYNLALLEAMAAGVPCVCLPHDDSVPGTFGARGTAEARGLLLHFVDGSPRAGDAYAEHGRYCVGKRFSLYAFGDAWRRAFADAIRGAW